MGATGGSFLVCESELIMQDYLSTGLASLVDTTSFFVPLFIGKEKGGGRERERGFLHIVL